MLAFEAITSLQKPVDEWLRRSNRKEQLILSGATALLIYNIAGYLWSKRRRLKLPPHAAYSLPIFGHSLYLMWNADQFIKLVHDDIW